MTKWAMPLILVLCWACSNGRMPTSASSPPSTSVVPAPPISTNGANWIAEAAVLTSNGIGCGWGTNVGDVGTKMWLITQNGASITLDEDMQNWPTDDVPFRGLVTDKHFAAQDVEAGGGVCAFRGGELDGTFSDDGLTFDALETLRWGSSEHFVTVQRRWRGRKF